MASGVSIDKISLDEDWSLSTRKIDLREKRSLKSGEDPAGLIKSFLEDDEELLLNLSHVRIVELDGDNRATGQIQILETDLKDSKQHDDNSSKVKYYQKEDVEDCFKAAVVAFLQILPLNTPGLDIL